MNELLTFVKEHFIIIDIIAAILVFALIGYGAEKMSTRDIKIRKKKVKGNKKAVDTPQVNMTTTETPQQPIEKL